MYQLHIANKNYSSWSLRPWVLMKELNIEFDEYLHAFVTGSNWDEFRAFAPNGTVPFLQNGDEQIWDSLAIIEYLAERHGGVWPTDQTARTWARCAASEMHSGFSTLRNLCPMNCGLRIDMNAPNAALSKDINRIDELWSQGLERFDGPFLAGDKFTAVDAFYAPVVFRAMTFGFELSEASESYKNRILQLDSMREWYEAALLESWREPGHEEESAAAGTITQDFRHS